MELLAWLILLLDAFAFGGSIIEEPQLDNPFQVINDKPNLMQVKLGECDRIWIRKEWRDLTSEEWQRFIRAYDQLDMMPYGKTLKSQHDYWTKEHLDHVVDAHGTPQFFPWHRVYVRAFEQQLQQIDPEVTIPYWDWGADWSKPHKSQLFSQTNNKWDISNCRYTRRFPTNHCLTREVQTNMAFYSHRAMEKAVKTSKSYEELWAGIEPAPHGIVHVGLGGEKGDMNFMWSPNDPIFWMHHVQIDRIWDEWQQEHPNLAGDYGGKDRQNQRVKRTDILSPFGIAVKDTFDVKSFCYVYEPPRRAYSDQKQKRENEKALLHGDLPPPLPTEFIHHHLMNETWVRESEAQLRKWMLEELDNSQSSSFQKCLNGTSMCKVETSSGYPTTKVPISYAIMLLLLLIILL